MSPHPLLILPPNAINLRLQDQVLLLFAQDVQQGEIINDLGQIFPQLDTASRRSATVAVAPQEV